MSMLGWSGLRSRRWLVTTAKLATAVAMFFLLLRAIDRAELGRLLASASYSYLLLGIGIYVPLMFLSALRWRRICAYLRIELPLGFSVLAYLEATAFNIIVPGSIGGEALRSIRAARLSGKLRSSIISVIIDRAMNFAAIVAFAAALLPSASFADRVPGLAFVLAAVGASIVIAVVALFVVHRAAGLRRHRLIREAVRISLLCRRAFARPSRFVVLVSLSAGVQACNVALLWIAFVATGAEPARLFDLAIITMAGMLATALPISFGGLGVREGAMIWTSVQLGIEPVTAYAVAFLFGLLITLQGVPGIPVWLYFTKKGQKQPLARRTECEPV